jgi:hypothetical protein
VVPHLDPDGADRLAFFESVLGIPPIARYDRVILISLMLGESDQS